MNESEYRMIQKDGVDIEMLPDDLKQTGTLFRCVIFPKKKFFFLV